MKPRVLIIITSDPRVSPRPAEAVRIAAGVGTWQRAAVSVYLRGDAVMALDEPSGALVNGEDFAGHWRMMAGAGQAVYVQEKADALRTLAAPAVQFTEIPDGQLAELSSSQNYVLRF